MFIGMAVGPTLGSLIIRSTGQLLSVFYAAGIGHIIYAILVWCILPQSLSLSYRLRARKKYAEELRVNVSQHSDSFGARLLLLIKRAFSFLTPLAVFTPRVQENENPLKRARRDWNLTLMGMAYIITLSIMASLPVKSLGDLLTGIVGFIQLQISVRRCYLWLDLGRCKLLLLLLYIPYFLIHI
jgi:MFS family permease